MGRRPSATRSATTAGRPASPAPRRAPTATSSTKARAQVTEASDRLGHPIRILVAKPGLDGHSNGAEQIAVRARDVGMEVVYQGIRLTPDEIAASAIQEDVDVVGLSILSGSHLELVPRVVELIRAEGADIPVVVGGIIPPAHVPKLTEAGIERVYTPKDFEINRIMGEIADLVAERDSAQSSRTPAGRSRDDRPATAAHGFAATAAGRATSRSSSTTTRS